MGEAEQDEQAADADLTIIKCAVVYPSKDRRFILTRQPQQYMCNKLTCEGSEQRIANPTRGSPVLRLLEPQHRDDRRNQGERYQADGDAAVRTAVLVDRQTDERCGQRGRDSAYLTNGIVSPTAAVSEQCQPSFRR